MSKGIIVERKANAKVPDAFLTTMLAQHPNCFGYACLSPKAGFLTGSIEENASIAQVKEVLEAAEDLDVYFYLGADKVKEEDAQPLILLKDEQDKHVLSCFLEGDFEDWHDTNGRTDEANFVKGYLQPKIDELFDIVDGDIAKLIKALQKETTAQDIMARYGKRGSVTFVANTGSPFTLEINGKRKKFQWGEASIAEGYEEYPKDAGTVVPKKDSLKERLAALKGNTASAIPGVHKTNAEPKQFVKASDAERFNKSRLKEDIALVDSQEMIFPDEDVCRSKDSLKHWYNSNFGTCPQGYHLAIGNHTKALGMPRAKLKAGSKLLTVKSLGDLDKTKVAGANKQGKDVDPKAVRPTDALPVATPFPIIGAQQKETQGHFIKNIDIKSMDIMDPTKIKEITEKASTWFDQHGVTFEVFCKWPPEKILELVTKWPNDGQLLVETLRFMVATVTVQSKKKELPSTKAADGSELKDRLAAMRAKAM